MDKLTGLLDSLVKTRYEEDFIDRLNYKVTAYMLIAAALTVSAKEYTGSPIKCWLPAQFADGWIEYAEDYCFIENTYFLPFDEQIPFKHADRNERLLSYYQWVPFILALQGLMFAFPHVIWRMLNFLSGIQIRAIITMAVNPTKVQLAESDEKQDEDTVKMIALHMKNTLEINQIKTSRLSSNPFVWIARYTSGLFGAYITCTYLFTKLLFIANCFLQFMLLNAFLGEKHNFWGYQVFNSLRSGQDWQHTGHFPRVTLCDFQVRNLGNVHNWTVQCVLMLNMWNEKIYLFLWWWLIIVTFLTIINTIYWIYVTTVPSAKQRYLEHMLEANQINLDNNTIKEAFNRFVNNMVRSDGIVVLRLMSANAGEIVSSSVLVKLWELCKPDILRQIHNERARHGGNFGAGYEENVMMSRSDYDDQSRMMKPTYI